MKSFCFIAALIAAIPTFTGGNDMNVHRVRDSIAEALRTIYEPKPKRFHFTGLEQIEAYRRNGRAIFSKSGSISSGSGRIHDEEFSQGLSVAPPSSSPQSSVGHHWEDNHAARGTQTIDGFTHNTFGTSSTISDHSVQRLAFRKNQGLLIPFVVEFMYPIWCKTKTERYLYDLRKSKGMDISSDEVVARVKWNAYRHDFKVAKTAMNILDLNALESANPKIKKALDAYNIAANDRLALQVKLLGREMTLAERKMVNVAASNQHLPQTDLVTASQLQIRAHRYLSGKYSTFSTLKLEELLAIEFNAAKELRILRRKFNRASQRAPFLKPTLI